MKKYILGIFILAIIVLAFIIPFGSSSIETNHYQNDEISFDYPASWQEVPSQGSQVVAFKDPESGMNVTVSRQVTPPGYTIPQEFVPEVIKESISNLKLASSNKIDVNGKVAYDNTYHIEKDGSTIEQRELWVKANGAIYSVVYDYPQEEFKLESILKGFKGSESSTAFDAVKNSFMIKSTKLASMPAFATVSIPRTGVTWNIRYDTLNAHGAVYHYPNSAYPGETGSVGLLGHHTLYSAPFNYVETIVPGDKIYINDFLTQKMYTYTVVSNNDIRYDYETNVIQFPAGSEELVIGTCWPPGSTAAERYVHCKLSSVDALN